MSEIAKATAKRNVEKGVDTSPIITAELLRRIFVLEAEVGILQGKLALEMNR